MTPNPPPSATNPLTQLRIPLVWQPGDLIQDTYEVKQVFTGGGLAYVYRVYHREWGIDLAVKSPKFSGEELPPGNVDYYVREAETWVKLGLHPNIVCCYFTRVLDGVPRIFMEFVNGASLLEAIEDGRLYTGERREALARLFDIAIQSAWGLNYAHRNGLIHQDVKPANVLLTPDGTAKVTDFGMAQAASGLLSAGRRSPAGGRTELAGESGRSILVDNTGMTPAYCSPEQAAGSPLTRRSDVWSWAVTVLEMFAGELAWEKGSDAPQSLEEILHHGPRKSSIPSIPPALAGLLRQCFAVQPEARPHDMEELSRSLQEIYAREVGRSYTRSEPHIETLLADTINNRAVSMVDLGKHQEALQLLEEAVAAETTHAAALFNRGLLLWRSARMTDEQALEVLEDNQKNLVDRRETAYLLGLIHLERGDLPEAIGAARQAREQYGDLASFERISLAALRLDKSASRCVREVSLSSGVSSAAISSQGNSILSGSNDGLVRLLDAASGRVTRTLEGHQGRVQSVAISPDGRLGLSGGWDGETRLWDLLKGTCLRHFQGHEDFIQAVAFIPGGRSALSASNDATLRLWDFKTGECRKIFQDHLDSVSAVLPLPNPRYAISASYDNTLRVWDLSTGQCAAVIPWYRGCTSNLALAGGGSRLLLAGGDQLWLLDLTTGQPVYHFTGHRGAIKAVQVTSNGRQALSGSLDDTLRLWDLETGRCLRTFSGHTGAVNSVAASPARPLAVSGGSDGTLRLWLLGAVEKAPYITVLPRSSKEVVELSSQVEAQIEAASQKFSAGDFAGAQEQIAQVRALAGYQQNPKLMDIWDKIGRKGSRRGLHSSWISQRLNPSSAGANTLAFLSNSQTLLTGSDDRSLRLWDLMTGQSLRALEGHHDRVRSAAVASGSQTALSGSSDGTLRLWNLETGECLKTLVGHANAVNCVAITSEGKLGLSGSSDSTVRVWDLEQGKSRRTLLGHSHAVRSVALTQDGRYGLSAGWDKTLQMWDLDSGERVHVFSGHSEVIDALALAPDGKTAITGGLDGTLRIWDLKARSAEQIIEGVPSYTRAITFSPGGRFVFTGDGSGSIQVWDLTSGGCIHTLRSHAGGVTSIALSPDARLMASAGADGFIVLWRLDWDYQF